MVAMDGGRFLKELIEVAHGEIPFDFLVLRVLRRLAMPL
jgi:hypothetical protein